LDDTLIFINQYALNISAIYQAAFLETQPMNYFYFAIVKRYDRNRKNKYFIDLNQEKPD